MIYARIKETTMEEKKEVQEVQEVQEKEQRQEILIIAENTGFFPSTIAGQMSEVGYKVTIAELKMSKLFELEGTYEAIILYMENEAHGYAQELLYLKDKAVEDNIPVFYIGDDFEGLKEFIPSLLVRGVFERPINVKETVSKIEEYIKINGRHVKKKILVVDDSGVMLRSVKGWLQDKYQVILANSGAMAIKYLTINRPDLVLLDYEMPVVDGSQVLEMMRTESEFSDIPVIFLTSKNDKASILKVMALKPEGYILKNTPPEQIKKEIDDFFVKKAYQDGQSMM